MKKAVKKEPHSKNDLMRKISGMKEKSAMGHKVEGQKGKTETKVKATRRSFTKKKASY